MHALASLIYVLKGKKKKKSQKTKPAKYDSSFSIILLYDIKIIYEL